MAWNSDLCDICCEPVQAVEVLGKPQILPGSNGSKVLNEHLCLYFIANKMLKCSEKDSLALLTSSASLGKSRDGGRLFSLCLKCMETVSKALELQYQIACLQNEISRLGKALRCQIGSCRRKGNACLSYSIAHELRELLAKDNEDGDGTIDFDNKNLDASNNIKIEVDTVSSGSHFLNSDHDGDDDDLLHFEGNLDSKNNRIKEEVSDKHTDFNTNFSEEDDDEVNDNSGSEYDPLEDKEYQRAATHKEFENRNNGSQEGNIYCKRCDSVYTTVPGIIKHRRMHTESDLLGNIYDCKICRHPNLSDSKLRRHMTRVHTAKGEKRYRTCKNRGQDAYENGKTHKDYEADGAEMSSNVKNESNIERILQKHKNRKHISGFRKRLIAAKLRKSGKSSLEQSTSKTFRCKFCESVYTTVPGFHKHMRAHRQSKLMGNKYDCPICRHPTISESNLRRHLTSIHEYKNFNIATHNNEDSSINNGNVSSTEDSGTNFTTSSSDGNFHCKLCESVYTTIPGIRRHERIHRESFLLGNIYDCPMCRHPTVSEKNLRMHITITHQNKISSQHRDELMKKLPMMDIERIKISDSPDDNSKNMPHRTGSPVLGEDHDFYIKTLDGNYRCKRCESVYQSVMGIRKHERIHVESDILGNIFDCSLCRHPTISEKNLRLHMSVAHQKKIFDQTVQPSEMENENDEHHVSEGPTSVDAENGINIDPNKPENKKVVRNHVSYVQYSDGNMHCKHCDSVYTTIQGMFKHRRMHKESDSLGNVYDCKICRHPNLSDSILRRHMTRVHGHSDEKEHIVKAAKLVQSSENENYDHHMAKEPNSNPQENAVDVNKTVVKDNVSYILFSDGNMHCKHCDSVYTTIQGMIKHRRMHTESNLLGNLYDCKICRHPNLSDSILRRHMTKVHGISVRKEKMVTVATDDTIQGQEGSIVEKSELPDNSCSQLRRSQRPKSVREGTNSVDDFSEDEENEVDCDRKDEEWTPSESHDDYRKNKPPRDNSASSNVEKITNKAPRKDGEIYLHRCEKCNVGYKSAKGYQTHLEEHRASISLGHQYDCHCGFPASSEQRLRYHKLQSHTTKTPRSILISKRKNRRRSRSVGLRLQRLNEEVSGKIECKICTASYWSLKLYNAHMTDHEKSKLINGVWDCTTCNFPCFSEEQLQRHKKKHERGKLKCSICQKIFANSVMFKGHMRMHVEYDKAQDPKTGLFCCKLCPFLGRSRLSLIAHKTAVHRNVSLDASVEYLLCSHCGMSFYTPGTLSRHIKTIHENRYPYTCEQCGKGFHAKETFNNHKLTHDKNRTKTHICDLCGAMYSASRILKAHIRKYHAGPANIPDSYNDKRFPKAKDYKCKYCPTVFPFKYMLLSHMSSSHQDRYSFSCDQCDRKYISASSLRLHKEISHSTENKTSCEYCKKTFVHQHYILGHYKHCAAKKAVDQAASKNVTNDESGQTNNYQQYK